VWFKTDLGRPASIHIWQTVINKFRVLLKVKISRREVVLQLLTDHKKSMACLFILLKMPFWNKCILPCFCGARSRSSRNAFKHVSVGSLNRSGTALLNSIHQKPSNRISVPVAMFWFSQVFFIQPPSANDTESTYQSYRTNFALITQLCLTPCQHEPSKHPASNGNKS
jgi:hypothetical protein